MEKRSERLEHIRSQIRAITFDFWGTLIDDTDLPVGTPSFSRQKQQYFRQVVAAHGYNLTNAEVEAAYRRVYAHFDRLWEQGLGFGAQDGIRFLLAQLRIELPDEVVEDLIRFHEEVVNQTTLKTFPGVPEAVRDLSRRYRLGIISDTAWTPGRVLRQQLARHGLDVYFQTMIFSGEIGYCKPNPRLFQAAIQALDVQPPQCLHIGDLQATDVRGAKEFGCFAAWIYRPGYLDNSKLDYKPDLVVDSVADLVGLLLAPTRS